MNIKIIIIHYIHLESLKGDPVELAVILADFYRLRRSEIVGLKWDAITFSIRPLLSSTQLALCCMRANKSLWQKTEPKTNQVIVFANGVSLKEIQTWLGHSHFSMTANIYVHLECNSKLSSAQVMSNTFANSEHEKSS
ncbi:Phage integrase family protein [compost metagenome]